MDKEQLQNYLDKLNENIEQLTSAMNNIDGEMEALKQQRENHKTQIVFVRGRASVIKEMLDSLNEQGQVPETPQPQEEPVAQDS